MSEFKEAITTEYFQDNAEKLNKLVDKLIKGYGGIYDKDLDDFYSLGGLVFIDTLERFDPEQNVNFHAFLKECLSNKIKSEITARNRIKRTADRNQVSLDTPISEDEDIYLMDVIKDPGADIEEQVFADHEQTGYGEKIDTFLSMLPDLTLEIAKCIMKGMSQVDTINELGITQKVYDRRIAEMRSFELSAYLL